MQPRRHIIVGEAQDLVGEEGVGSGGFHPGIGLLRQPPGDLRAARAQRLLEDGRALRAVRLRQQRGDRAPVDDLALVRNGADAGGHLFSSSASRFSR